MDVRNRVVRRWVAVAAVVALLVVPTHATASTAQAPERGAADGEATEDRALVDVPDAETLAQADQEAVADALEAIDENVVAQLEELEGARGAVGLATAALADADAAVQNTELAIEELTAQSDAVVIDAFTNPPAERVIDVLASESVEEAAIKQAVLDRHSTSSADVLTELDEAREALEAQRADQEQRLADAQEAQAAADQALGDLETALNQQAEFVLAVQTQLASEAEAATDPDDAELVAARQAALQGRIDEILAEEAQRRAEEAAEQARREAEERAIAEGTIICPVDGEVNFSDTWGAARSGGRSHKGTDMMASTGTPTVAPVTGRVEHRGTSLGGLSWYVYGDNGHTYYGTHLSSYANEGIGRVTAGTLIGYVGHSGNASADAPHLHFEYHQNGGSAVNPYPLVHRACPDH